MAIRLRFLLPAAAGTVVLTALCIITALFLFQQQSAMTGVLRENVTSRRAAVELEECLYDISALLHDNIDDVSALHVRLNQHLVRLRTVADQPEEKDASRKLDEGLAKYLQLYEEIPAHDVPDHVEIGVTDSGVGIAADMLPTLFQPFSSNKETGLGLGLVILKRIVEDHGGSIEAENPETGGAAFRVRLPREK